MKKTLFFGVLIILISFLLGIFLYPKMGVDMASHWNLKGEVNGYLPKFWGLFLMPILSVLLLGLFLVIPNLDPKKENIKKFKKYYDGFIFVIILFLFYLYLLTIFWNLNYRFDFIKFIIPPFALLFFYLGILIENAKRNWFIGIRTPWTIESEKVWDKTHKLGGILFKICGLISLTGLLIPQIAFFMVIIPIMLSTIITIIYSYIEYKKL